MSEYVGFRLTDSDSDIAIGKALAGYTNKTKRIKDLIMKGIALELYQKNVIPVEEPGLPGYKVARTFPPNKPIYVPAPTESLGDKKKSIKSNILSDNF